VLLTVLVSVAAANAVTGAQPTAEQVAFFENEIRPVLAGNCYSCHSAEAKKVKGGLWLDSRDGVLQGGDSGPAVVPGHPEKSLLITAVRYTDEDLQMPPKGKKLSEKQIAALEQWVRIGAPDPRTAAVAKPRPMEAGKDHWAWQPLSQPSLPKVKHQAWCQTPVDRFILAQLDERGLAPNPPADKRTLIRRAYYDLIGLPPTAEQVQAFLADDAPDAFARVVESLLASPHYGERWGRHWLDTARYSDTKGEIRRFREDPESPHAWVYRDYVIRSFNADKPFNQFILEQIAADQLPGAAEDPTPLAALGFLTVGDRYMGMQNDIINDQIDVVTKGFLGLTVSCARCHDHKFDPVPQSDYYSLHGIFASSVEPRTLPIIEDVAEKSQYADYEQKLWTLMAERSDMEKEFIELRRTRDRKKLRELQRRSASNLAKLSRLEMEHPGAPRRAMVLEDLPRPRNSNVLIRGEAGNKGPVVPRQFLALLSGPERQPFTQGSGRLELAQAIADPANPLTSRVLVNRVWLKHFGEGFVPTPDDLGTMSEPPSHPALLDYLAATFIQNGWSLKHLHRQILLSATWQQSSEHNPRKAAVDADNRLLWRQNIRRLDMEPIRDSLLAISGTLEPELYGKPFNLLADPLTPRRTIYARVDRQRVPEMFFHFDFATPDLSTGRRHVTTVPQQTLFFMNHPMVIELSKELLARPDLQRLSTDEARVTRLYELLYQRPPREDELALAREFLADTVTAGTAEPVLVADARPGQGAKLAAKGRPAKESARSSLTVWQEYAQALLQANEFIFVQ
jgi:cytochrome c553